MWKDYHAVTTIGEALELLAVHGEQGRIVAGGTDLLIEIERGQRKGIDVLIDITRVPGLDAIEKRGGDFRLGCLVTHQQAVADPAIVAGALPLAQASWEVGAPQIRNRATIAGNLITASPANDTITPLRALGASVTLSSLQGERTLLLNEFHTGLRRHVMRADEMLTAITFPALAANERGIFLKLGLRRAQAISVINAAVVLQFDGDRVARAAIALGCVAPTIFQPADAERYLVGRLLTEETIAEAARLASIAPAPISDVRGTAAYRTEMIRVLVARSLRALAANTQAANYPTDPALLWGASRGRGSLAASVRHMAAGDAAPVANEGAGQSLAAGAKPLPGVGESANPNDAATPILTTINGRGYAIATGQNKTLLRFLREDAHLPGTKEGCAEGECGACTVFLDGAAVMACMVPAPRAHGAAIVTVEGLANGDELHPIQQAFIECNAVQCGYCTPGFLMAGAKLLEETPQPTRAQIETSIAGNLCRCTGYYNIIEAFERAGVIGRDADALSLQGVTDVSG